MRPPRKLERGGGTALGAAAPGRESKHPRQRVWLRLAKSVVAAFITLWVISIVAFGASNLRSPEQTARSALGFEASSPVLIQAYIKENGLDRPIYARYGEWLGNFVRGDFGISYTSHRPIRTDLLPRFISTLRLALISLLIGVPLSIAIGVYMAARAGTRRDFGLVIVTVALAALPEFVLAIGVITLFGVYLGVLPVDSTALAFGSFGEKVEAHILPVMVLVLSMMPYLVRITRAATREELAKPYVRAALLRGLPRRTVLWAHAVRNAAITVVNAVALNVVWLLGGVIIVENIFGYPGMGQLLVDAVGGNDATTIQAIAMLMGAMFIGISLVADLVVVYLNPRLRTMDA